MNLDSELEPEEAYQTLSTGAVVACILGLLSPLVVFGKLLSVFACLAIILALSALRTISQADGAMTGRRMALVGLALGTASLSAWLAYGWSLTQVLHSQAKPVAEAFLGNLQEGNLPQAYMLTLRPQEKQLAQVYFDSPASPVDESDSPQGVSAVAEKVDWFNRLPAVLAVSSGKKVESYRLLSRGPAQRLSRNRTQVSQTWKVQLSGKQVISLDLSLESQPSEEGLSWRVVSIGLADAGA